MKGSAPKGGRGTGPRTPPGGPLGLRHVPGPFPREGRKLHPARHCGGGTYPHPSPVLRPQRPAGLRLAGWILEAKMAGWPESARELGGLENSGPPHSYHRPVGYFI